MKRLSKRRRVTLAIAATCVLAIVIGCLALPRYEAVEELSTPYLAERLADDLDPWLLADGFADALAVEIDWVEGCRPGPRTLLGFERIVRKYVPSSRRIEIHLDDEIPSAAWDDTVDHDAAVHKLVTEYAGTVARLEPRVEKRYVLFVPEYRGNYGVSTQWTVERGDEFVPIQGVVVAHRAHVRSAKLWLSIDRFERSTLIHEFGHEFGLTENDRHERVHPQHRKHCTGLTCLMAHPTPRVIARNALGGLFNVFPRDYCKRCQEDIRRAQDYWRNRMEGDPGFLASMEADRDVRLRTLSLRSLFANGRHEELLTRVAALEERFPGRDEWVQSEALALLALDRAHDALERLLSTFGTESATGDDWRRRQLAGRILVALGRHDEAIELFDPARLHEAEPYEFEQSTFVLLTALRGLERFAEAAAVIDELLARGHHAAFDPHMVRATQADLLRLAGKLDEADALISAGLADKERREAWLGAARALRRAQGRSAEARALLMEMLDVTERRFQGAEDPRSRWYHGWQTVRLLAEAGEPDAARKRAGDLEEAGDPEGVGAYGPAAYKAPAWLALGEPARAAELIEALGIFERGIGDPCGMETLAPLRRDPRYRYLFESCPAGAPSGA